MVVFLENHKDLDQDNEKLREDFNYTFVGIWNEGLAKACQNGHCFHIRKDGVPAYPQRYEDVDDFCNGFASVRKGDLWSHIKTDGSLLHGKWFQWALDFKIYYGLEKEGLLAMVREQDQGRNKGKTYKIRIDGTRFDPQEAPKAQ
ncbi:MAG: WG repeat-containing protein [Parcubacteria group bacterium]|nr:MAG: WG repeat-containing protein [Parcubacteria group bacterium]